MRNLIAFLTKYHYWFVFVVLEVISMVLLFQFNSYQGSVWFSTANYAAGKVYEANSAITQFFELTNVNKELTQRNLYLEQQVQKLSDELTEATGDSLWMHRNQMAMLKEYKLIPAKVITNSIDKADNLLTINKGSADGVKADMGVVSGNGVVGIVFMTSAHYSIVIPVLNSRSNISCVIKGRKYFGSLHWLGKPSDLAYVEDIPRHAHFKLGEDVVTSGYSSVFPPGIQVGKILHVFNSPDGMSYRLQVRLATNFGTLRDVCVIDNASMTERLQLMRAAQDSTKVMDN